MDKQQAAKDIITHTLPLVPAEGWNEQTLAKAALAAGYKKTDAIRVFPAGGMQAVDAFFAQSDAEMERLLQGYSLGTMKIRERIATAVRIRISLHENHREALRKAIALQAMPFHALHGLRSLYRTTDTIWHAVGDTSTDFNFYTKRLMLAGVFSSTLLYWLDDKSAGYAHSWAFLDRRIGNVMRVENAKRQVKQWLNKA